MVFFHSIDVVLGNEKDRAAWRTCNHLPRVLFPSPKGQKRVAKLNKKRDYGLFKRMQAVKEAVFSRHQALLRLYQRYCNEEGEDTM